MHAELGACTADACVVQYLVTTMAGPCRQLVAAWVAVVQDYAVLGTHGPLVQAAYTPRLFPAPSLSIIVRLQPNLHSCWPAALTALAVTLPQAAGEHCRVPALNCIFYDLLPVVFVLNYSSLTFRLGVLHPTPFAHFSVLVYHTVSVIICTQVSICQTVKVAMRFQALCQMK